MNRAGTLQYIVSKNILKCNTPLTWKKVHVININISN